ncbi:MAG: efflux RND transporter permease subunit [Bacteroidota bacterium]|nr:efflux RND transporter permease subunit [Bacteroidota bacterium]
MFSKGAGLLKRPIAVMSWCVAVVLAGIWAAVDIPIEYSPNTELPRVSIGANWAGASPQQVERYVTAPIEREIQNVPGIVEINSISSENSSHVQIQVDDAVDLSNFATQVGDRITLLRDQLPEGVTPRLTKQIPEAFRDVQGFMTLSLLGPYSPDELRKLADESLKPEFESLPGIDLVEVTGGTKRELLITLLPARLDAYGIDYSEVRSQISQALRDHVFGRMNARGRGHLLISHPELDVARLGAIIVSRSRPGELPVRLDQVATLELGPAPRTSIRRIDGLNTVALDLERTRGSHMIDVARAVHDRVEEIRESLPEGGRLIVAMDRTENVRELLSDLALRGGIGLILVMLVLLFMLKSVRATAIVLFSVAVALAPALALFRLFDLSLNVITLAGLVLVFGLLVDNSVVVVEQLQLQQRKLAARGLKGLQLQIARTKAALEAVWLPLLGGTLSTMAVMLPLVYLSGDLRDLFLPFGILVSLTLLISLASAVVFVPVVVRFLPPAAETLERRWLRRAVAAPYRVAARFPKLTVALMLLILGVPIWKLPQRIEEPRRGWSNPVKGRFANVYNFSLGSPPVQAARVWIDPLTGGVLRPFFRNASFYKPWSYPERTSIGVRLGFAKGNTIERSDSLISTFEDMALASESVYRTDVRITESSASLQIEFKEGSLEQPEPYLLQMGLVGRAILLGGMSVSVGEIIPQTGYYSGGGGGFSGSRVRMYGPNYEELDALAHRFSRFVKRKSRRVMGVDLNGSRQSWIRNQARQVLRFRWDGDATARAGAAANFITYRLQPYFETTRPFWHADIAGDSRVPIRIIVSGATEIDIDRITQRPLVVPDSSILRLAGLADYEIVEMPANIERENQQYVRHVSVDYRGPFDMRRRFMEESVESFPVPPGYRLEYGSNWFFDDETKRAFSWVFLATIILVFLVTAAIFESWCLPLVVMLSVPLAAVGVCVGFLSTGASFVEGAFIGTVLLVGIAVNDSILLTDRFRQLRVLRPYGRSSILARMAVRERLRPMWTTTLTSAAAMLPLLVFPDESDFWTGLAVTVTAGLFASTLLAPFASVGLLSLFKPKAVPERVQ